MAFALEALSSYSDRSEIAPAMPAAPSRTPRRDLNWMMTAAWGTAVAAALALGRLGYLQPAPSETPVYRSSLIAPAGTQLPDASPSRRFALSPDGRRLAFTAAAPDGRVMLWVRPLDGLGAQALAGTEDAVAPFWSPDSRLIGVFAGTSRATGGSCCFGRVSPRLRRGTICG